MKKLSIFIWSKMHGVKNRTKNVCHVVSNFAMNTQNFEVLNFQNQKQISDQHDNYFSSFLTKLASYINRRNEEKGFCEFQLFWSCLSNLNLSLIRKVSKSIYCHKNRLFPKASVSYFKLQILKIMQIKKSIGTPESLTK